MVTVNINDISFYHGNLLEVDNLKNYVIVHSCNCQGKWGGFQSFAEQLKKRYPGSYKQYVNYTDEMNKKGIDLRGSVYITETTPMIACLYTSKYYGVYRDNIWSILENTQKSIRSMFEYFQNINSIKFLSPKINSGKFGVPWHETYSILMIELARANEMRDEDNRFKWTVCYDR